MANRKCYIWRSAYSAVFAVDHNFLKFMEGYNKQSCCLKELLLKICYNCLRKSSWDSEEIDGRAFAVNVNSRYGGLFFENGHHDGYSIRKSVLRPQSKALKCNSNRHDRIEKNFQPPPFNWN